MQYRNFGKLDWKVSALGFGCMRLPTLDDKSDNIDQSKTTAMIRRAVEAGVNYFDTAYTYHEQMSEIALGKALEDGYRERVCLATKSPVWRIKKADDFDAMLDEQLKRLQTDRIDFYLLHSLNREHWQTVQEHAVLRRAEDALTDGRIRYLGFSFHDNLEMFKNIVDSYDGWTFCQIQYNYMDTDFQAGTAGLHYAASKGLGVVVMEPLRGGKLAKELPAVIPLWSQVAQKRKPADWAFQWLWNQPEVSMVLSGMSTFDQLEENLASANTSGPGLLSSDELELIRRVREVLKGLSLIPCTYCEYCLPCPNGVDIPSNFEAYNQIAIYHNIEQSRYDYKNWMPDDQKAARCIQCDECLPKCPQQIAISTWMPIVEDVLGRDHPYVESLD